MQINKRQKKIMEKPIYVKMLLKRLFLSLAIVFVIGGVGTAILLNCYAFYQSEKLWNETDIWIEDIEDLHEQYFGENRIGKDEEMTTERIDGIPTLSQLTKAEREEQFCLKICETVQSFSGNQAYVLYDEKLQDITARYGESLFVHVYESETDSCGLLYYCDDENVLAEIQKVNDEAGYSTYLSIEDYYIDGFRFIPGKMLVKNENSVLKEFDFTPEDAGSYLHITKEEFENGRYITMPAWIYSFDSFDTFDIQEEMKEYIEAGEWRTVIDEMVKENEDGDLSGARGRGALGSIGYEVSPYMINNIFLGDGEEQQEYWMIAIGYHSMFEDYLIEIVFVYGMLLAGALLIAFVGSFLSYRKQLSYYEMDQYRRELTNTMAHDLKSPLMVISGFAENLLETELQEKQRHYTDSILGNVQYMNRIIENVLELSKVEKGEHTLKKEELNLRELTEEILMNYKLQLEEKGLDVEMSGDAVINADSLWMKQVVDNLISNAVKYATERTVVEICMDKAKYKISNASAVTFDRDVNELAKPFVKGDNSRSGRQGSGIGLTIVKNIVEQHGYQLELECQDGTFVAMIVF